MRLLSLTALVLVISPLAAEEPLAGRELFPLAAGNSWSYRIQGQSSELLVVKAESEETVGEWRVIPLEGRLHPYRPDGGRLDPSRADSTGRLVAKETIAVRKDGAYRCRLDGSDIDPPMLICKFPPEPGSKWRTEYKFNDKKAAIDYECGEEEVIVPAGKFKCIVIRSESGENLGKFQSIVWYAPKVGMVKQISDDGENRVTLSLDNYSFAQKGPPKKGKQ